MPISDTPIIKIEDVCCSNHDNIPQVPVFRPTEEEFNDFSKFIELIEKRGAHHMGVCKIIPPSSWVARKKGYIDSDLEKLSVPHPILQTTFGNDGIYVQDIKCEKSMSFKEYREYSELKNMTPTHMDWDDLERKYWSNLTYAKPQYGANVSGTLTDESQQVWNIAKLPTLLDEILVKQGLLVDGVNTPYLYYGSWQTTFGWHVEDVDLYSINYLHYGMPKHWYVIPPAYARKFELIVRDLYKADFLKCNAFLRHKTIVLSPTFLKRQGIPTRKIVQEENEFMFTFPYGYHSGFNMGLNIAESTNFASPRWIEFGKQAILCQCWPDTVKINMEPFVRIHQSEFYDSWLKNGNSLPHPLKEYEVKFAELKKNGKRRRKSAEEHDQDFEDDTDGSISSKKTKSNMSESSSEFGIDLKKSKNKNNLPVFFDIFTQTNMKKGSRIQRAHPMKSPEINSVTKSSPILKTPNEDDVKPIFKDFTLNQEIIEIGRTIPRLLRNEFKSLWRGNSFDLDVERNFNELIGNFHPHCAVCSIIWPISKVSEVISNGKYSITKLPKSTEPHIPQLAFSKAPCSKLIVSTQLKSQILRCCNCKLTVHARCYGKIEFEKSSKRNNDEGTLENWRCDRCVKYSPSIYCCICCVRGGAIKKVSNSTKWAHIVCTLGCQNMSFDDVVRRRPQLPAVQNNVATPLLSPLNTSVGTGQSQLVNTSKCCVCRGKQPSNVPMCSCTYRDCQSQVHVTCAYFHNLLIESETHPQLFFIICEKHPNYYTKQPSSNSTSSVVVGDHIYAQSSTTGYYYLATVVEKVSEAFCKLTFPTGEYSDDTEIKYIKSHNIARDGAPSIGTVVTVLWTEGELIDVQFQGLIPEVWKVKFKNLNMTQTINRDQFYKTSENIPLHVERFLVEDDKTYTPKRRESARISAISPNKPPKLESTTEKGHNSKSTNFSNYSHHQQEAGS